MTGCYKGRRAWRAYSCKCNESPGEVVVSKDINLDIHEGEFVVFVGPSGCGKSTLLRMIAGLETITSGDLFIGEKRMNDTPPAERGVGMVFQSYALYPHLSVAENMSFGLKLAGAKEVINQRVNGGGSAATGAFAGSQTESALRWSASARGDWPYAGGRAKRIFAR